MSDSDVQLLYQTEINVGHDPIVSKHQNGTGKAKDPGDFSCRKSSTGQLWSTNGSLVWSARMARSV